MQAIYWFLFVLLGLASSIYVLPKKWRASAAAVVIGIWAGGLVMGLLDGALSFDKVGLLVLTMIVMGGGSFWAQFEAEKNPERRELRRQIIAEMKVTLKDMWHLYWHSTYSDRGKS